MNNKRGLIGILAISVIALAVLAVIAGFFLSSTFKWVLIGGGLVTAGIFILKEIKDDRIKAVLVAGIIGVGIVIVLSSNVSQTVLSVSEVDVRDGKAYWLVSGTANNVDDGYDFGIRARDHVKDGVKYEPQKRVSIFISKEDSYCTYQLEKTSKRIYYLGLIPDTIHYKILTNPSRNARVRVSATDGREDISLDAFNDRKPIMDIDGKGEIMFETLGLIGAEKDCPNYENVVVYEDQILYRNQFEDILSKAGSGFPSPSKFIDFLTSSAKANSQFTQDFDSGSVKISSNQLKGDMDIGSVLYALEADQDYFDSLVIIPDEVIKPKIEDVKFPTDIKAGDSSSMKVELSSSKEGRVRITVDTDEFSVSPSSKTISLDGSETVKFNLVAQDVKDIPYSVIIKACGSAQFSSEEKCDTFVKTGRITGSKPSTYCGDGTCQSNEDYESCPEDCEKGKPEPEEKECPWYQETYTRVDKDYGFFYWRLYTPFVDPIKTEVEDCRIASWVTLVSIGAIVAIMITVILKTGKKKRRRRR